ncbi:YdcH family protein [Sulfurovum sp. bin170]|uniref:YdcH family protein n=1 Tax=Sulfurovum sp. bin170 TaxID=2695268 RepID=UPI0013DEC38B|nr:YdcH family protein [Sulfurovum sp. bin170]NEW61244.1 YdcH family protein [Sulfurovum sp. bin170]
MLAEYRVEISELKQSNAHFTKIFNDHNKLDQDVQDAEHGRVGMSDMEIEVMKKKKLILKDEMLKMILESKKV